MRVNAAEKPLPAIRGERMQVLRLLLLSDKLISRSFAPAQQQAAPRSPEAEELRRSIRESILKKTPLPPSGQS